MIQTVLDGIEANYPIKGRAMSEMTLTDEIFKKAGFNIDKEPFFNEQTGSRVYKNYVRDGSGEFDGYIIEKKVFVTVHTVEDLLTRT